MSFAQENDEFYDALCSPGSDSLKSFDSESGMQFPSCNTCGNCVCTTDCKCRTKNGDSLSSSLTGVVSSTSIDEVSSKGRRRRSFVPPKAEHGFSLWSLIKHCMGKDLTKIPLPVYFNEPLSTLQRLTEEYEYAYLLAEGCQCEDSYEQMVYVAAFVVSSYSSSSKRTGKPFNPLLGETFECDRTDDLGWKCISEQVSHHPPVLAQHCESKDWIAWQEFSMTTKLKGASLQVNPMGTNHLKFKNSDYHYTWNKVSTTVHNLVIGSLWLEHHGEIKIRNHTTGDECSIQFLPYKCFSSDTYRKVSGTVSDRDGRTRWLLQGTWDSRIFAAKIVPQEDGTLDAEYFKLIWKRIPPSIEDDKYYNMTHLACQLNELESGVAPTDSRLRPDQRQMENGFWDEANSTKVQLEEKQRQKRRLREEAAKNGSDEAYPKHTPVWFKLEMNPIANESMHVYTGEYWDCKSRGDWSRCPDIFL